jgi:hypothetical protein
MPRPLFVRPRPRAAYGILARLFPTITLGVSLFCVAGATAAEIRFWVDAAGVTHFTDDPEAEQAPQQADSVEDLETLRNAWSDGLTGPMLSRDSGDSSGVDDRIARLLRGAKADLERGEVARADSTLRGVLRLAPRRPEAHWYLAMLSRGRGRFRKAEEHLRSFLDAAGPEFREWRREAENRLASLADERALADPEALAGPLRLDTLQSEHFRVQVDSRLGEISRDYATRVMGFLEAARSEVSEAIGVEPLEPLGVVLYGRAAYVRAHAHRFSFQTIGFFDGRIHVASPAHPTDALRGILFHEYTHAVFREYTGGDRPYWLNEGLAEQIERRSRGRGVSTRSERATLRANIELGSWIPLASIAESFSGLSDESARDAYLQSVVTAGYIERHSDVEARRRLLERLGEGFSIDQALHEMLGLDSQDLDQAVRDEIRAEFPDWNVPGATESESVPPNVPADSIE